MRADATITTVDEYLESLPEERRAALAPVRQTILANLPDGYVESMTWGMPTYEVPLERYPNTYNGQPLMYAAFASQKRHMAVYLSCVYADGGREHGFRERYRQATGKDPDMGKSCVRFTRAEQLPLDLLGDSIASTAVDAFISLYESARKR